MTRKADHVLTCKTLELTCDLATLTWLRDAAIDRCDTITSSPGYTDEAKRYAINLKVNLQDRVETLTAQQAYMKELGWS